MAAKFSKANLVCTLRRQVEALQKRHGFKDNSGWAQVVGLDTPVQVAYGQFDQSRRLLRFIENGMLDNAADHPIEYSQKYSPITGRPSRPGSRGPRKRVVPDGDTSKPITCEMDLDWSTYRCPCGDELCSRFVNRATVDEWLGSHGHHTNGKILDIVNDNGARMFATKPDPVLRDNPSMP